MLPLSLLSTIAVAAVLLRPTVMPATVMPAVAASSARMSAPSASAPDDAAEALALYQRLKQDAEDTPLGRALKRVLGVCRNALRLFGPDGVVVSFNGGKDANVMCADLLLCPAATGYMTNGRFSTSKFVDDACPPQRLLSKRLVPDALVPDGVHDGAHDGARDYDSVVASLTVPGQVRVPVAQVRAPSPVRVPTRTAGPGPRMSAAEPAVPVEPWTLCVDDAELGAVLRVAEEAGRAAATMVKARLGADVVKTKASRGDLLTEVDGAAERLIEARVRAAFPTHAFLGEESVAAGAKASAEAIAAAMDAAFDGTGGGAASEAQSSGSGSGSVSASTSSAPGDDWLWIVDPIDGTTNFVQSLPIVGISIGAARRRRGGSRDPTVGGGGGGGAGVWEMAAGVIVDPFKGEVFSTAARYGAFLDGVPIRVSTERLADAVVATGFAPNQASLRPMARGIVAVGARARTVRMLGSAAIMLAWVACGRLSAYFEADLNAWDTAAGVLLVREAGGLVTELSGAPFGIASRPLLAANAAAHAELRDTLVEANVIGLDPE
jgi:myo-inositol-1(or 4)-monophosphatase